VAAAAVFGWMQMQKPVEGSKSITVEVAAGDQDTKTYTYQTDYEYLGKFLLDQGLISGDDGQYGLYVTEVDGTTADFEKDGTWWMLSVNGEMSQVGVSEVVIQDGDVYTWTLTNE
jgi:hypothetical protein